MGSNSQMRSTQEKPSHCSRQATQAGGTSASCMHGRCAERWPMLFPLKYVTFAMAVGASFLGGPRKIVVFLSGCPLKPRNRNGTQKKTHPFHECHSPWSTSVWSDYHIQSRHIIQGTFPLRSPRSLSLHNICCGQPAKCRGRSQSAHPRGSRRIRRCNCLRPNPLHEARSNI